MRKNFEQFCTKYENFLMIGDINLSEDDVSLDQFMQELKLEQMKIGLLIRGKETCVLKFFVRIRGLTMLNLIQKL